MEYKMPKVQLGDTVFWFPGGNPTTEPSMAHVSRVGRDNICLNIVTPTSYNFMIRDGVRHCDDPRAPVDQKEEGGWLKREDYWERQRLREEEKQLQRELADEQTQKARLQTTGK